MKKSAEAKIAQEIANQNIKPLKGAVRVDFTWYEPNRNRDLDNICFAKKFILDSLVNTNTIECDGWRGVVGFTDTFAVDHDNPRIEVRISEVQQ